MKNFAYCLLAVASSTFALAQANVSVHGIVADAVSGKTVTGVNLLLRNDSGKVLLETASDSLGAFMLIVTRKERYSLTAMSIGYVEKTIGIMVDQNQEQLLDTIKLEPHTRLLKEVTVMSRKSLISSDINKLTYHAENDLTTTGGDASDVLRKTPMVEVDQEGTVSLKGSSNPRILINGKTSALFLHNAADGLKSIPAKQISRIEVITNPSAKYDGDGSAGIINIVTKKNLAEGINGVLNTSAGNQRNYGSLNVTARHNDLLGYVNLNGNFMLPRKRPGSYVREDFMYNSVNRQKSTIYDSRNGAGVLMGVDYTWKALNVLQASACVNSSFDLQRGNNMEGAILQADVPAEYFTRDIESPGRVKDLDLYLDYTRKFRQAQKLLAFSAFFSQSKGEGWYTSDTQFFDPEVFFLERADKRNRNTEITFQGDFTVPLWKGKLEMGTKFILRDFVNDFKVYRSDDPLLQMVLNEDRTNLFRFGQNVSAGYAQYEINLSEKTTFRAGGRLEFTSLVTESDQFQQTPSIKNNYANFLPSLAIARRIGEDNQLKLGYSKRLHRPGTIYLNPFISAMNSYNRSQGNPYLEPEIVHSFELGYSLRHKSDFYGVTIFYRATDETIERYTTLSEESVGERENQIVSTTKYGNIGRTISWGANLTSSILLLENLDWRSNVNLVAYHMKSASGEFLFSESSVSNTVFSMNTNVSWRIKDGWSLEGFFTAATEQRTLQGSSNGFTLFNIAARKSVFSGAGNVGLVLTEPFRKGTRIIRETQSLEFYERSEVSAPNRSIMISFSLNFGKLKAGPGEKKIVNDDLK